jgi:chitinase
LKIQKVDCKQGPKSDKDGFSALVKELSAAFKPKGLLLTAAVSPSKKVIDEGYDVPVLNQVSILRASASGGEFSDIL